MKRMTRRIDGPHQRVRPLERLLRVPAPPKPRRQFWKPLSRASRAILFGLLVLALAVWVWVPGTRPQDVLVRSWRAQWSTLSDSDVAARCEQIASLGDDGVGELVRTACHPRIVVSRTAAQSLDRVCREWNETQRSSHSQRLSALLKSHVDQFNPAAIPELLRVVRRLVAWPITTSSAANSEHLLDCEFLLTRFRVRKSQSDNNLMDDELTSPAEAETSIARAVESVDPPVGSPSRAEEPAGAADSRVDLDMPTEPQIATTPTGKTDPITNDENRSAEPIVRPEAPATNRDESSYPHTSPVVALKPERLDTLTDRELVTRLRSGSQQLITSIRDELRNRGFSELHLFVATQFSDSDPQIRKKLLRSLPKLNIDSRPWLLWLATDPDPEVRSEAIALIATSPDPALQSELETILADEVDVEIRRQTKRLPSIR